MKSCDLQNKRLTTRVVESMNKFCLIYHQYRNSVQLLESYIFFTKSHPFIDFPSKEHKCFRVYMFKGR